jgi:hypothetical protein
VTVLRRGLKTSKLHMSFLLFHDVINSSVCITSNERIIYGVMNLKGRGLGLFKVLSQHLPGGCVKTRRIRDNLSPG